MDNRERLAAQQARRALERLAALTLFLTPLLMNPLGQSLCGRIKIAALWAAAGGAGFLLSRLRKAPIPSRLLWPGALWLTVTTVTVITGVARISGFWAAVNLLPGVVLALAFAEVARKAGARRRLMIALSGSAGITSAYAIIQHYGIDFVHWTSVRPLLRAAGTIGAPIYLGAFLAMALPFALALSRHRKSPRWLNAAIAAMVIALAVSYSRAAWGAAAAGVIVMFYSAGRSFSRPLKPALGAAAMMLMMALPVMWIRSPTAAYALAVPLTVFVLWWLASLPGFHTARRALVVGLAIAAIAVIVDTRRPNTEAWERIAKSTDSNSEAASARHLYWTIASGLIHDRPVMGYGPDGFRIAATTIAHDNINMPEPLLLPHQNPHSEWYSAGVEGGAVGLLVWVMLVLCIASVASDRARVEVGALQQKGQPAPIPGGGRTSLRRADTAAAVFGGIAAFVVQGSLTPRAPTTTLCLALCWGITAALEPALRTKITVPARLTRITGYGWCGVAVVMALSTLSADIVDGYGERLRPQGRLEAAVPYFRLAAQLNPTEVGYRRVWGEAALNVAATKQGMEAIALAEDAVEAYTANLNAEPDNGIWRAGLAQALCYLNKDEAVTQARQAVNEAKVSATTWMALSRAYRASGNAYGEKYTLRAAIESEPMDPAAFERLACIFRDEKRPDLSNSVLGLAAKLYPDFPEFAQSKGKEVTR